MITKIEIHRPHEFYVAGISIRTTNQNGQSQNDIGGLWNRLINEGIVEQVQGRLSDDIYSVYTDYESDHTGFYTVLLGCKVPLGLIPPEGLTIATIQEAKYQVYTVTGEMPASVMDAWQEIWNNCNDRTYTSDFECYSANEEGGLQIYIAVA